MITAMHTLIYSDDAEATRAFFRDVLEYPFIREGDAEPPWLIFATGPSELGVHPTSWDPSAPATPRRHELSLMCDDVEATRAELEGRGATFSSPIMDQGFGIVTMLDVPGADPIMLYQPKHEVAHML